MVTKEAVMVTVMVTKEAVMVTVMVTEEATAEECYTGREK